MSWKKEEPLEGRVVGCGTCGYKPQIAHMHRVIAVGFGQAELTKNGKVIWEEGNKEFKDCINFADAEDIAKKEPDNDWRVRMLAPLSEVEYQRHGVNQWVLIRTGEGFA